MLIYIQTQCLKFSVAFGFFPQEFELRKHARQEGRRYCDPVVLTYQAERMPEQIRLKVRVLTVLCSDAALLPILITKSRWHSFT